MSRPSTGIDRVLDTGREVRPGRPDIMCDRFQVYKVALKPRGRRWLWSVCTTEGSLVMTDQKAVDLRPTMKPIERFFYCC